jgi:sortase A
MIRKAGFALGGLGLLLIAWVAVTAIWGDPITSLYTRHEQHVLADRLARVESEWAASRQAVARSEEESRRVDASAATALVRERALRFRHQLRNGSPIGRIVIPRIGLKMVVVEGTDEGDLQKGPGHYNAASGANTGLPGMGRVIAIAGHRTTYLHPFRHIDELDPGDNVYLQMPYGTFRYRVYFHRVVASNDWSILRSRPYEKLVLSACHPLYSASHRWIVFARLVGVSKRPLAA